MNHPHITVLHDIGQQQGVDFLVMEYLDGETLAVHLERGPLPLEEALTVAIGVADALDNAHRSGMVHPDIRPARLKFSLSS